MNIKKNLFCRVLCLLNTGIWNIKKYTIQQTFEANVEGQYVVIDISNLKAKQILGAIPTVNGGQVNGSYTYALSIVDSPTTVNVHFIPSFTQLYYLTVYVFWR